MTTPKCAHLEDGDVNASCLVRGESEGKVRRRWSTLRLVPMSRGHGQVQRRALERLALGGDIGTAEVAAAVYGRYSWRYVDDAEKRATARALRALEAEGLVERWERYVEPRKPRWAITEAGRALVVRRVAATGVEVVEVVEPDDDE